MPPPGRASGAVGGARRFVRGGREQHSSPDLRRDPGRAGPASPPRMAGAAGGPCVTPGPGGTEGCRAQRSFTPAKPAEYEKHFPEIRELEALDFSFRKAEWCGVSIRLS